MVSAQRVTDIMGEISRASVEQEREISRISQAISEIDTVAQHNAALVEEASDATASLNKQAEALAGVAALFKITMVDEEDKAGSSYLTLSAGMRRPTLSSSVRSL